MLFCGVSKMNHDGNAPTIYLEPLLLPRATGPVPGTVQPLVAPMYQPPAMVPMVYAPPAQQGTWILIHPDLTMKHTENEVDETTGKVKCIKIFFH
jgi:hypothetical protein